MIWKMYTLQNYSKSAFQAWISFWLWMCSDDDDNEGRYAVLVPAGWGWWLTSDWGLGGVGVWLSPFSAGVILWSFDSEGASLNVSTCPSYETFSKCKVKLLQNNLNPKYHLNQAYFHFADLYFQTSSYEVQYKKEENKKDKPVCQTLESNSRSNSFLCTCFQNSLVGPVGPVVSCSLVCRHSFGNPLSAWFPVLRRSRS